MEKFVKGDVVVLPFPYTNFSQMKKRPALVIANLKGQNVILAQITTNHRNDEDLISLKENDFLKESLNTNSFIMTSILFTTNSSIIFYKAGKLKPQKTKEVQKKLIEIFSRE